jgi:hypothetical protein
MAIAVSPLEELGHKAGERFGSRVLVEDRKRLARLRLQRRQGFRVAGTPGSSSRQGDARQA